MRSVRLSALLALLLPLSCKDLGTEPPLSLFQDDIREAVFRFQFLHNDSGQQQSATAYYLAVFDSVNDQWTSLCHDPSNTFMSRFVGQSPPVKKLSQCTYGTLGVIDRETGQSGLIFRLGAIWQTGPTEVVIEGGYFEGGLSASGNRYWVQRIDGQWIVVKYGMMWIS